MGRVAENGQPETGAMPEETLMISILEHPGALSFGPFAQCVSACLLGLAVGSGAPAQTADDAIYGVTALDVAPGAASQGIALIKQYRDGALKQAGNTGVILLQEVSWPNRFVIYDAWKDQAAYDANERAAHSAELRARLASMDGAPCDRRDYRVISVGPAQAAAGGDTVFQMQLHVVHRFTRSEPPQSLRDRGRLEGPGCLRGP
jgi:quinol monooxygenase YgiN